MAEELNVNITYKDSPDKNIGVDTYSGILGISDFILDLKSGGIARNNRFQIEIVLPDGLLEFAAFKRNSEYNNTSDVNFDPVTGGLNDIYKKFTLRALTVEIPGYNLSTQDMNIGANRQLVYDKDTTGLTIKFLSSENLNERRIFDYWLRYIIKSDDTVEYYDNYVSPDLKIVILDDKDIPQYQMHFNEAYPSYVSPIQMMRDEENQYITFDVSFNHRKMYELDSDYSKYEKNWKKLTFDHAVDYNEPQLEPLIAPTYVPTYPAIIISYYQAYQRLLNIINNNNISKAFATKLIAGLIRDMRAELGYGEPSDRS